MSGSREAIERNDPRSLLEEAEAEDVSSHGIQDDALRHVLAWVLEGRTLAAIGTRVYIAAYIASPDAIGPMTLHQIAKMSGQGRSATHNLAKKFEAVFGVKSIHARTDEARQRYSDAFHARNGCDPHRYNPTKGLES